MYATVCIHAVAGMGAYCTYVCTLQCVDMCIVRSVHMYVCTYIHTYTSRHIFLFFTIFLICVDLSRHCSMATGAQRNTGQESGASGSPDYNAGTYVCMGGTYGYMLLYVHTYVSTYVFMCVYIV